MHIIVIGLRGFPEIQGGIEVHSQYLYPLLVQKGCEVEVVTRSRYMSKDIGDRWQGVRLLRFWSPGPRIQGVEAFIHSFLGVLYAASKRPDVLHIHAIGPAIMTPLARLLGLRVVVTHHTQDYAREKWGKFARWLLRTGERLGMCYANERIVISRQIQESVHTMYHCNAAFIPNGVGVSEPPKTRDVLDRFGLESGRYVLLVSRFDPGKRHTDLIQAFVKADLPGWKLVLVGALTPPNAYIETISSIAKENPNIILTDFQSGPALQELYANAGIFVLPSSHEGLPIVLLEALSYGIPVLASDIPANVSIGLPEKAYFPLGDVSTMARMLHALSEATSDKREWAALRERIKNQYDWKRIAEQTLNVYQRATRDTEQDISNEKRLGRAIPVEGRS